MDVDRNVGIERTELPLALQHFHDADWTEIAAAFEGNDDPGFGALQADEFRRLFSRVANLMPVARVTSLPASLP